MNNLFILVGASGVGKSTITEYIRRNKDDKAFYCIKKHTNRPMRKEEIERDFDKQLDLIFEKGFDTRLNLKDFLVYQKGQYFYWIEYNQILNSLKRYKNCFILTTGFEEAKNIKKRFLYDANCVICYIHTDSSIIRNRMMKDNYTDQEIEFRVKRTIPIWDEYVHQNYNTVQHCILNNGAEEELYMQINNLINLYN